LTQSTFRERVVGLWQECAVTGIQEVSYLVASHIKPWRLCTEREKLDPENGLLLNPSVDKLFDIGHISFDDMGYLVSRQELWSSGDLQKLGILPNMSLSRPMTRRMTEYMRFHRETVFKFSLNCSRS
ncbi:MAG: HNH endonuclease signature motif containing protein, partial [Gammaproteobacteria bacterium]|nr:HNH endonuclease signature motif containing protein [Gammaproteobacteria bacterium]